MWEETLTEENQHYWTRIIQTYSQMKKKTTHTASQYRYFHCQINDKVKVVCFKPVKVINSLCWKMLTVLNGYRSLRHLPFGTGKLGTSHARYLAWSVPRKLGTSQTRHPHLGTLQTEGPSLLCRVCKVPKCPVFFWMALTKIPFCSGVSREVSWTTCYLVWSSTPVTWKVL